MNQTKQIMKKTNYEPPFATVINVEAQVVLCASNVTMTGRTTTERVFQEDQTINWGS